MPGFYMQRNCRKVSTYFNPGPTSQAACLNSPIVGGACKLVSSVLVVFVLFSVSLLPSPSVPLYWQPFS